MSEYREYIQNNKNKEEIEINRKPRQVPTMCIKCEYVEVEYNIGIMCEYLKNSKIKVIHVSRETAETENTSEEKSEIDIINDCDILLI